MGLSLERWNVSIEEAALVCGGRLFHARMAIMLCVCYCVDDLLPVSLAGGINVLETGRTWLEKHLLGQRIWFKPLRVSNDHKLECIVHARTVLFTVVIVHCVQTKWTTQLMGYIVLFTPLSNSERILFGFDKVIAICYYSYKLKYSHTRLMSFWLGADPSFLAVSPQVT